MPPVARRTKRGGYVFSLQEHRQRGNVPISERRCTPSMRARPAFSLGQPRTLLRFPLAIPLTRLRIVVPGREEERGHRRVSPSSPCQRLSAPRFRADVRVENAECRNQKDSVVPTGENAVWIRCDVTDLSVAVISLMRPRRCRPLYVRSRASGLVASKGRDFSVSDLNKSFHPARLFAAVNYTSS